YLSRPDRVGVSTSVRSPSRAVEPVAVASTGLIPQPLWIRFQPSCQVDCRAAAWEEQSIFGIFQKTRTGPARTRPLGVRSRYTLCDLRGAVYRVRIYIQIRVQTVRTVDNAGRVQIAAGVAIRVRKRIEVHRVERPGNIRPHGGAG